MMTIYLTTEDGTQHEITTDQASFGFIVKLLIQHAMALAAEGHSVCIRDINGYIYYIKVNMED